MGSAVAEILAFVVDKALGPLPVGTIVLMVLSRRARRLQVAALAVWAVLVVM